MTDWTSIVDVAREFGLQEYETDAPALRDSLKRVMSSVHPDKNGGLFKSDQDKALFMRTKAALDYMEVQSQSGLALIPLSHLPAIVSAVSQALTARPAMDSQALQSHYMADAKARISRRFVLPKIGSGVFAAITGFLCRVPRQIREASDPWSNSWRTDFPGDAAFNGGVQRALLYVDVVQRKAGRSAGGIPDVRKSLRRPLRNGHPSREFRGAKSQGEFTTNHERGSELGRLPGTFAPVSDGRSRFACRSPDSGKSSLDTNPAASGTKASYSR